MGEAVPDVLGLALRRLETARGAFHGDVEAFLNHLVVDRRAAGATQNQALHALVFLYKCVLDDIGTNHLGKFALLRSKRRLIERVPERGNYRLMVKSLYGTGLRVSECCTLRVRDIDFGRAQIIVRQGKGDKDRVVMLPCHLHGELGVHLAGVERRWRRDVAVVSPLDRLVTAVAVA